MSVLAALRAATASLHEALDSRLVLTTRAHYASFLRGTLAVVQRLEPRVFAFFADHDEPRRAWLIERDLDSLGEHTDAIVVTEVPAVETRAAALGARYVLEGSTLGGLVLATNLERTLALEPAQLCYLRMRGGQTVPRWRAFLTELEAWSREAAAPELSQACAAAVATFDAYTAAYESVGLLGGAG